MMNRLRGVIPALPTPLTQKGDLDCTGVEKLVDHLFAGGIHGLWVLGSTSEFPSLNEEERETITDICVRKARGRVPVIVGIGHLDFRTLIKNAECAARAGADACFATLPYYYTLDTKEAVEYVRQIAAAVPLPFIFYDNPFSTNVRFTVGAVLEIADLPNVIAIKDSAADFSRFLDVANSLADNVSCSLFQGIDQLAGPAFLFGAAGAVLALASIIPTLFVQLYESAIKGDIGAVKEAQRRVLALCRIYQVNGASTDGSFFAGVKAALEVLGICDRYVANPFSMLPKASMQEVEAILLQAGAEQATNS